MTEKEAYLILNAIQDIGSVRTRSLVQHFGSAEKVVNASCSALRQVDGIGEKLSENICRWKKVFDIRKECKLLEKLKLSVITIDEPEYPARLKEIYDPPVVLYVKGGLVPEDRNAIAMVGARDASYYGINTARRFARELASRNITIVSGLARGVDTAAHAGAVQAKGRTIAVLGCGLSQIYPPDNNALAEKIIQNGAIVSEFPLAMLPLRQNFPRRNRIISGLCMGVVVVEAGKFSGSLITARLAGEQGRDVFSIPGRIDSAVSEGANVLIKNGAKPVFDTNDILDELNLIINAKEKQREEKKVTGLSGNEEIIFKLLTEEPIIVDDIVNISNMPVNEAWAGLVNLELKGLVKRLPGSKFVKK